MYKKRRGNYSLVSGEEGKILDNYLKEIAGYPVLTRKKEREIFKLFNETKGEEKEKIKQQILKSNLKLVIDFSKKYFSAHPWMVLDIIQQGNLGLITAIERFEYKKNNKFSTYAFWWVKQKIEKYIDENREIVRISKSLSSDLKKIGREEHSFFKETGKEIDLEEIIKRAEGKKYKLSSISKENVESISLDALVEESDKDSVTMLDLLEDTNGLNPQENYKHQKIREILYKKISKIPNRYREIILLYFGLKDNYQRSLEEVGEIFDLTRERVRQIIEVSLRRIRNDTEFMEELEEAYKNQKLF